MISITYRSAPMRRVRLDTLLSERGMFPSRTRAAASVLAGDVLLLPGRRRADKPGQLVPEDVEVELRDAPQFASRGGVKLANALDALAVDVAGRAALDVGASTGGFTDCLLQRDVAHVVALDVAYGELDWRLRNDPRVTVIERRNARSLRPDELPYAPDLIVIDVSFISLAKVLGAVLACAAERFDCLALVKPQFEVGRGAVGKGGVVRDPARAPRCAAGRGSCGLGAGRFCGRVCELGPPWAEREPRDVRVACGGGARAGRGCRAGGGGGRALQARRGGRAVNPVRTATVFTHRRPTETGPAVNFLVEMARDVGAVLRFDPAETRKHRLELAEGLELDAPVRQDVDICFALGGDGTILSALRTYAGTSVPVFGINFGEIGFLATVDRDAARSGFRRAFAGEFEVLALPGISVSGGGEEWLAINDVSMHRQPGNRVADLAYGVGTDEVGRVHCDGLVVATPAGSTGYNLANGGPVMAWGVEGFVVSFIAPHSLTARSLVVSPTDVLTVHNRSREEPVDVTVDGRPVSVLAPGEQVEARFVDNQGSLAQVAGATFYERLRQKFGRLATAT